MQIKGLSFAKYSRNLCWVVALIWLLLSILTFTGDGVNSVLNGFLWLAGAVAFAISAMFISKNAASPVVSESDVAGD